MQATYVPPVFGAFSFEPLILFPLAILFSGGLSLSKEESGTHLNFKNQKVEVMSLFYGFLEFYIVLLIPLFSYQLPFEVSPKTKNK